MSLLHAPHIVESTVTRMEEMEASMHSHATQVTTALQRLRALVDASGQPWLEAAWAAYEDLHHLRCARAHARGICDPYAYHNARGGSAVFLVRPLEFNRV